MSATSPLLIFCIFCLVSCDRPKGGSANAPPPNHEIADESSADALQENGMNEKIDAAKASSLWERFARNATPTMAPSVTFPVKEITPPEMWERMGAQLFVVTDGVHEYQSFATVKRNVIPLGGYFGGSGLMTACVTDLNGDGTAELLFTHSFGSGMHRSHISLWTGGTCINARVTLFGDNDLGITKRDDQHVAVQYGSFDDSSRTFTSAGDVGTIRYQQNAGVSTLDVLLDPRLPEAIRKRISIVSTPQE
jgi:hypothetical protein